MPPVRGANLVARWNPVGFGDRHFAPAGKAARYISFTILETPMTLKTFALTGIAVCLLAGPALAHHSFAMFDQDKTLEMTGMVKEVEWVNPHSWIHLMTTDAANKPVVWSFEVGSLAQLAAEGWKRENVKVGDKIKISYHPLKDGSRGGQLQAVTTAGGVTLCHGRECRAKLGVRVAE